MRGADGGWPFTLLAIPASVAASSRRSRSSLSRNRRDAEITFNSFVYRLCFCAASTVLRRIGHLPDIWTAQSLALLGAVIHDPHITWVEGWRQFEQCSPHVVRARHGDKLYRDDYSGYCDGVEIRKEPSSSILLPCRWCCHSIGYHCDYGLDKMTPLNNLLEMNRLPLPRSVLGDHSKGLSTLWLSAAVAQDNVRRNLHALK